MTYMTTIILLGFGSVREGLWGTFVSPAEKTGFGGGREKKERKHCSEGSLGSAIQVDFLKNC